MTTARLRLLGRAQVFDGQQWFDAPLDKRFGLLAYLACAGDRVEREKLAFLFWPDAQQARAKSALRFLIHRTKALRIAADLETQPTSLRWSVETDVQSLRQAAQREDWGAAVALYSGDLLAGFDLGDSPEYDAWLELERKGLLGLWRNAVLKRAAELEDASQYLEATALLRKLVDHDEFDEEALQGYLRTMFVGGRRHDALEAYEEFAAKLLDELGLEPLPATQGLVQALRTGQAMPQGEDEDGVLTLPLRAAASGRPEHLRNVPQESTAFVGRDLELTEIVNTLSRTDCRLLTLVGPGGIGKSRLALRAAKEMVHGFADGATFVPLAPVATAAHLPSAIATALSLSFFGPSEPEEQLLLQLRDREMLLVLDNLEHLLEGSALIANILTSCPRLKILATSRERLRLRSEWLLPVEGMGLPESEQVASPEGSDALQLFFRCARQVRTPFVLDTDNSSAALRICQLVGGAPLGIELASVWLRLLSCEEIVSEMERDLDFLSSSFHDVPERHRSLRRVFEHSWRLLSAQEQTAFKRLSVFRGGFTRAAAEQVAEVSMRSLLALLEKSLIKRSPGGRFDIHELVKQYAAEKLGETAEEEQATLDRHCTYYATFLQQRESQVKGRGQPNALQEIDIEIDNIRSAWDWAVGKGRMPALERFMEALAHFYSIRSLHKEGVEAFRQATDRFTEETVVLGRLLTFRSLFEWWLRRFQRAVECAERSLAILNRLGAPPEVLALAHLIAGVAYPRPEGLEQAKAHFVKALQFARSAGDVFVEPRALHNLGITAEIEGSVAEAERHYRQGIDLFRQTDEPWGLTLGLKGLGRLLETLGDREAARRCYLESLTVARGIKDSLALVETLILLGALSYEEGQFEQARGYYSEVQSIVTRRDDIALRERAGHCLIGLGKTALALQDYRVSIACFHEGLTAALAIKDVAGAHDAVIGAAHVLADLERSDEALELLAFALRQPGTLQQTRARAERLYATLAEQLSGAAVASAQERGEALQFDKIARLLREWQQHLGS